MAFKGCRLVTFFGARSVPVPHRNGFAALRLPMALFPVRRCTFSLTEKSQGLSQRLPQPKTKGVPRPFSHDLDLGPPPPEVPLGDEDVPVPRARGGTFPRTLRVCVQGSGRGSWRFLRTAVSQVTHSKRSTRRRGVIWVACPSPRAAGGFPLASFVSSSRD